MTDRDPQTDSPIPEVPSASDVASNAAVNQNTAPRRPVPGVTPPAGARRPVPARPLPGGRRTPPTSDSTDAPPPTLSAIGADIEDEDGQENPLFAGTQTVPAAPGTPRTTLTGEVLADPAGEPTVQMNPLPSVAGADLPAPGIAGDVQIGSVQARPTPAPLGIATPGGPTTGPAGSVLPVSAPLSVAAQRLLEEDDGPAPLLLLARYLGVLAVLLVVLAVWSAFAPNSSYVPLLLVNFAGGLLLPILDIGPWRNDDGEDAGWFALCTLVFGPLIGLIIYGVKSAIQQSFNASVMGCFVVAALTRVTMALVVGHGHFAFAELTPFTQGKAFSLLLLLTNWAGLLCLVGWFAADVFHKLDE